MEKDKLYLISFFVLLFIIAAVAISIVYLAGNQGNSQNNTSNQFNFPLNQNTSQNNNQNNNQNNQFPSQQNNTEHAQTAFIAIHCEPGDDARTTDRPEHYWPKLVDLVELADEYDVKLTLMFNPQWATYILADETKLELVRSWEANGHEIAAHHHGPSYGNSWDGYTNEPGYKTDKEYLGNMTDYINLLNQLPAGGRVYSGGIASASDKPFDWPEGIIYSAEGIESTSILSTPTEIEYNGQAATELSYGGFELGGVHTSDLPTLISLYETSNSSQYIGLVFHESNYAAHPQKYEQLFQFLNENDIEVKTLGGILSGLGY
jgi:hypothetical protein